MELSIVVPVFDRANVLSRAVGSIPRDSNAEIVIVDDGSRDLTPEVVAALQKENPSIIAVTLPENRGVNYARNRGIERASGEWISLLDSDDEYVEGGVPQVLASLRSVPADVDVVGFMTYREVGGAMQLRGYRVGEQWREQHPTYPEILFKDHVVGDIHYCVRRSIFAEGYAFFEYVNGFESAFFAKLAKEGKKFLYLNVPIDRRYTGTYEHLSKEPYKRWPRQFAKAWRLFVQEHRAELSKRPAVLRDYYARIGKTMLRYGDPAGLFWIARSRFAAV